MEPLWSPGVATGGNQRQIGWLSEPQNMVRRGSTVRVRQRDLQKSRKTGFPFRIDLQVVELDQGMEPFMEPSGRKSLLKTRRRACRSRRTGKNLRALPTTAALQQLERVRVAQQRDDGMRRPRDERDVVGDAGEHGVVGAKLA